MKIKDDYAVHIDDHKMIANKFISDYTHWFMSTHNNRRALSELRLLKRVVDLDNEELTKPPNLEEVRTALFSINSIKTPRPDGFGSGFFKTYWHIIKKDPFN